MASSDIFSYPIVVGAGFRSWIIIDSDRIADRIVFFFCLGLSTTCQAVDSWEDLSGIALELVTWGSKGVWERVWTCLTARSWVDDDLLTILGGSELIVIVGHSSLERLDRKISPGCNFWSPRWICAWRVDQDNRLA
jgi:hypothetical protein